MAGDNPVIRPVSDHSLLVVFGETITPEHHRDVIRLSARLLSRRPEWLRDVHPAYATVLAVYDPFRIGASAAADAVRHLWVEAAEAPDPPERVVEIPVLYGGAHGPDLADVAAHCGLDEAEVVRRHAAGDYRVYFLGFSPGFPYLGGLDEGLATPRLPTPRHRVPAGSVAIGGRQTGVYPAASPGGWRLIGRTPLRLFDPGRTPPACLAMGDRVRFVPVDEAAFAAAAAPAEAP
jgi:KipI family sensor histidine kinase inhibitor